MPRFRIAIVWLAAIFVVVGSTFGFAKVGQNHGAEVSAAAKPSSTPESDDPIEAPEAAADAQSAGDRPENHGFFVSQAAHCEDVDDPATPESPDFTAPEDCTGAAHGEYVSSVARSSAGKKDHPNGNNGQRGSEGS